MAVSTGDLQVVEEIKQRARKTWAAGDYDAVADGIWAAGAAVTRVAGVAPGAEVLDIACGTGNAAIQAAQAGGTVTGVDLTPELLTAGRRRAEAAGVDVEFMEGDAEALPFEDSSFDVVLSTFGAMFTPRHSVTAAEIARVLRPGGRIGLANWGPDGSVGEFFQVMAGHMPRLPPVAEPPLTWGTEAHVRELLGGEIDLTFAHTEIPLEIGDEADPVSKFLDVFPPLVTARNVLEQQGAWEAAEPEIRASIERMYEVAPTYLLVGGSKHPG
jgi:SAM-dependent methyltransferase